MSIVERALQKAQLKSRKAEEEVAPTSSASSTAADGSVEARTPSAAYPPGGFQAYATVPTPVDVAATSNYVTSGDPKAVISVDVDRLRNEGRLPSVELARQTEEEMRRIKWPLLNSIAGRDGVAATRNNVVLVTSALPGEGKTFTSLNLALSIVRDREMRVVLVDGDVARPGLTPTLGLEGRLGLNDVLEDTTTDVGSVTYQTDVPGLFFVPAGRWHDHSPEFFAGSRMPQLIEELSRRVGDSGIIIFDSPPLLATNDAQALTRYVGQVLLVVRSDHTEQQAVLDALALVDKAARIHAVLNRVSPSVVSRYFGQYYYGYGYGSENARDRTLGKGGA